MRDIPVKPMYITRYSTLFEFYQKLYKVMSITYPLSELQPKQLDFFASLWAHNYLLLSEVKDYGKRSSYIFSTEGMEKVCKPLKINIAQARNYRSKLANLGLIIVQKQEHMVRPKYMLDPMYFVLPDTSESGVDVVIKLKYTPKSNRKTPLVRGKKNEE